MWVLGLIFFFPAENLGVEVAMSFETQKDCVESLERYEEYHPPKDEVEIIVVVDCEYKPS